MFVLLVIGFLVILGKIYSWQYSRIFLLQKIYLFIWTTIDKSLLYRTSDSFVKCKRDRYIDKSPTRKGT